MLYIQDPTSEASAYLLDSILHCAAGAVAGGGAYAFVSADGINLLIGDPVFQRFLRASQFHLIIGMDEITNTRTLQAISQLRQENRNLSVHAFLHDTAGSIFHPKFCWFEHDGGGYVVTGSGNLTQKGMQRNREAFDVSWVSTEDMNEIKGRWDGWLRHCASCLRELDDPEVIQRAGENAARMRTMYANRRRRQNNENNDFTEPTREAVPAVFLDDETSAWEFDLTSKALIAEIPRGGPRWNQANFDAATFQTYFESAPGVAGQMSLILRDVKDDGTLGEIRHRPPVSVASQNYRIELYKDRGVNYPEDGRVLGVFVKLSRRTFLYSLVFPQHAEYAALQAFLNTHRVRADRLVRYQTDVSELQALYPDQPILSYLCQAERE